MKNLITYLLLFMMNVLFCPNNYWTIGYCVFSLILFMIYFVLYRNNVKKEDREKENLFNGEIMIVLVMIFSINMIAKMELTNLVFGYTVSFLFLITLLKNIFKKSTWKDEMVKATFLFDYYSLLYMGSLLLMVINHEI